MSKEGFLRNFIFGVNDALVSTVGFVSGIAVAAVSRENILLAGTVLIVVEAFSMGVGSFLSDESVREARRHGRVPSWPSVFGSFVMFGSYLVAGFLVLAPYALFRPGLAFWYSVGITMLCLSLVGASTGKNAGVGPWFGMARMVAFGGAAIALGTFVGELIS